MCARCIVFKSQRVKQNTECRMFAQTAKPRRSHNKYQQPLFSVIKVENIVNIEQYRKVVTCFCLARTTGDGDASRNALQIESS